MSKDSLHIGQSGATLRDPTTATASASLAVCIVTPDLLGPVKNGGIGTACTYLAHELAMAGHQVSILFAQSQTESTNSDAWIEAYNIRNIRVTVLENIQPESAFHASPDHPPLIMAYRVYQWLAKHDTTSHFDIVIFMEWQGTGFYALHAKKCGILFQNTALIVQVHSPSLWHSVNNADLQCFATQSITWHMERQCIEMADAVTSPSAYMVEWCREQGYMMPSEICILPNFLTVADLEHRNSGTNKISELVFFGRLEYRKGIVQFCDAVDELLRQGITTFSVTFLGKPAWVGQEHAGQFIGRRTKSWPIAVTLLTTYDHYQALEYLSEDGRLAVMPSVADNSPYTVYECLKAQIPFIARNVGGIPELLPQEAHNSCLCSDTPFSLAEKMRTALTSGISCPSLAFTEEANRANWKLFLCKIAKRTEILSKGHVHFEEESRPLVSVCLTHYSRPHLLLQAIESLIAQDYPNFEVILADDGSPDEESKNCLQRLQSEFEKRDWKILRLENGYPGKARNEAVRVARGEWLLFFDDDNIATPCMLRQFVSAALHSKSRLVACSFFVFSGKETPSEHTKIIEQFLPVGNIVSWSTVSNAIGDTTTLIHRALFRQLGGFTENYGLGHEDFELLLKAVLAGAKIQIVPEPLFWYRRATSSIQQSTNKAANRLRSARPFMQMLPPALAETALLTHALAMQDTALHERKTAAPPHLDDICQTNFAMRSPESLETICAVADSLTRNAQHALAQQLLESVNNLPKNTATAVKISSYSAKACLAISKKDYAMVLHYAAEMENTIGEEKFKGQFYINVLDAFRTHPLSKHRSISTSLCNRLFALNDLSYQALLATSACCLEAKLISKAIKSLNRALLKAEGVYYSKRPDVKQAVHNGQFTCALHHYLLHGSSDEMSWPDEEQFSTLTQRLSAHIRSSKLFRTAPFCYIQEAFSNVNAK